MCAKKNRQKEPVDWVKLEETPWQVWGIRIASMAALATCLIADNGSPTLSSLCKVAFLQPCMAVAAALWLPLALADRRYRPSLKNPVVVAVLAFCAALGLTMTASADPSRSFWSSVFRLAGVFNYWHFAAWFLALACTHRTWRDWRPLLVAANWIGMAVAFIGFFRYLGEHQPRLASTIDNALYVAAFLLLQVFIALILHRSTTEVFQRTWYKFCVGTYLLALLLTGSRSATAAAALGLGLYFVYLALADRERRLRRGLAIGGTCVVLAIVLLWLRSDAGTGLATRLPTPVQRILLTHDFGSDRSSLAAIAWSAFKDRPILGYGLEMYEALFERYYQPTGRDYRLAEPWYDRAHNQFAEFLATGGVILFTAYVALWVTLFWVLIRRLRERHPNDIAAPLVAAFIAYAAAMLFSFDMPGPMTVQWLLIAMTAGLTMPLPPPSAAKKAEAPFATTALFVVLLLIGESYWSLKPYIQARRLETACRLLYADTDAALDLARRLVADRTYATPELEFRLMACADSIASYEKTTGKQRQKIRVTVSDLMSQAVATRPYDYKTTLAAAYTFIQSGAYDASGYDTAERLLTKASQLSPLRSRNEEEMGELALRRGQAGAAATHLEAAAAKTVNHVERVRLLERAAFAAATADDLGRAVSDMQVAAREPEADISADGTVLPLLANSWPVGQTLPEEIRDYANLVADRYQSVGALQTRYRLFDRANDPSRAAALEALRTSFPDVADFADYADHPLDAPAP